MFVNVFILFECRASNMRNRIKASLSKFRWGLNFVCKAQLLMNRVVLNLLIRYKYR